MECERSLARSALAFEKIVKIFHVRGGGGALRAVTAHTPGREATCLTHFDQTLS